MLPNTFLINDIYCKLFLLKLMPKYEVKMFQPAHGSGMSTVSQASIIFIGTEVGMPMSSKKVLILRDMFLDLHSTVFADAELLSLETIDRKESRRVYSEYVELEVLKVPMTQD